MSRKARTEWLLFAAACLLFLSVVWLLKSQAEQDEFLKDGRDQRIAYQADRMYLDCQMIQDDLLLLPEDSVDEITEICEGYSTPEDALKTELGR